MLDWWPRTFFLCNFYCCELFCDISSVFSRQPSVYGFYLRFCQILAETYTLASLSFSQARLGKLGFWTWRCFFFSFWCALGFCDAWRPWHPKLSSWSSRRPHCRRPSHGCCCQASTFLARQRDHYQATFLRRYVAFSTDVQDALFVTIRTWGLFLSPWSFSKTPPPRCSISPCPQQNLGPSLLGSLCQWN